MKLLKPLPPGRSYEQIMNHYMVEKSIAERLKKSSREERSLILATMYDELFSKVPDHPRLTRRESEKLTSFSNKSKIAVLSKLISKSASFVEFAPGDCRFAYEVAKKVKYSYGIDISDQRNPTDKIPDNFKLIVYDGYSIDQLDNNSIDVVFSDQLIEHLHEEDTRLHFELVRRILKKGGKYVFRTPHLMTGPHDISQYFSYKPECFHFKEWTYIEMKRMLSNLEYTGFHTYWNARGISLRMPNSYFAICELVLGQIPKRYMRSVAKYLIPSLCGVAIK